MGYILVNGWLGCSIHAIIIARPHCDLNYSIFSYVFGKKHDTHYFASAIYCLLFLLLLVNFSLIMTLFCIICLKFVVQCTGTKFPSPCCIPTFDVIFYAR